jgi:hypothetical protein
LVAKLGRRLRVPLESDSFTTEHLRQNENGGRSRRISVMASASLRSP